MFPVPADADGALKEDIDGARPSGCSLNFSAALKGAELIQGLFETVDEWMMVARVGTDETCRPGRI